MNDEKESKNRYWEIEGTLQKHPLSNPFFGTQIKLSVKQKWFSKKEDEQIDRNRKRSSRKELKIKRQCNASGVIQKGINAALATLIISSVGGHMRYMTVKSQRNKKESKHRQKKW
jgi:hypothetical protein